MEITTRQHQILSEKVYKECGINLHHGKLELLKARLAKRMRVVGINSTREYIDLIQKDEKEFLSFIDAVSTNHTFFFRENRHCEFMMANVDSSAYLKIWSAASSSGEEPYSIAVQLVNNGYRFDMFASDISNTMLTLAQRGIYYKDKLRLVPHPILRKYFQKGYDRWEEYVRVKKAVRDLVVFGRHNLVTDRSPGLFDIIFCRNVMIYFDDSTRQKVIDNLFGSIKQGGYLIIGAAEGLVGLNHDFKYIEPSIYQKL